MDTGHFIGLEPTHNRFRWKLPVTLANCTPGNFLFGGAGLAAAIGAMEATTGRPCIWATGQYVAYAAPGSVLDIDVHLAAEGHQVTQARAVCHVADQEILVVLAALGRREFDRSGQFERMPDVPPPEACDRSPRWRPPPTDPSQRTLMDRIEQRIAIGRVPSELDGTPNDGRTVTWIRTPDLDGPIDATHLALLGDFVPQGVSQALGIVGGGNSLDNTLRIVDVDGVAARAGGWVLLDTQVQAVARGFAHGHIQMYAPDGTLLATASQSCIVRYWVDPTTLQRATAPPTAE